MDIKQIKKTLANRKGIFIYCYFFYKKNIEMTLSILNSYFSY